MRPSPYRWIPIVILALALFIWLSAVLLPRFVGGLLGQGDRELNLGSQAGSELPEIVWDTRDPRRETSHSQKEAASDAAAESSETSPQPVAHATLVSDDARVDSEYSGEKPSTSTSSQAPASAAPGEGPGEGRQRAARLLYQEWPRQEVLARIRSGGIFRFWLRVESDGQVSDWELLESYDCELCAQEAERIVRGLRFRPALEDGRAVACWLPFEIRFFKPGEN